jgi:gamma-glutamyltranspeptidase / glutathione hydrolase
MTLNDLQSYKVVVRKPLSTTYRNLRLTTTGAPSGGAVTLTIMKILEGYAETGKTSHLNLTTHRFDEAMKFAFGEVRLR